jgi:hypothetical protein
VAIVARWCGVRAEWRAHDAPPRDSRSDRPRTVIVVRRRPRPTSTPHRTWPPRRTLPPPSRSRRRSTHVPGAGYDGGSATLNLQTSTDNNVLFNNEVVRTAPSVDRHLGCGGAEDRTVVCTALVEEGGTQLLTVRSTSRASPSRFRTRSSCRASTEPSCQVVVP